jgi:hypothetical protein
MIRDLGPTEGGLSTAQRILIDRTTTFLGVVRLIEEYVREKGVFANPGGFLNPALSQHYLSWNRAITNNLALLGIDKRKADEALDLRAYAERTYGVGGASQGGDVSKAGEGEKRLLARPGRESQGKDKASRVRTEDGGQVQDEGAEAGLAREGDAEGGGDE